ncbi:MAG TPA: hypothetical protein VMC84_04690 [Methanocella sp.]|uniref:DUF7847 domain-containing protein n=1 Tax=Methanocella sp. TaxID=2052833 RepID=UPI002C938569|nr:hypothetical protein [Methanocella sp.]HTY90454.1 hypothetical protein [Methanocella sp.]
MEDIFSLFGKSLKEMGKSPVLLIAGFVVGALALPLLAGYGETSETIRSIAVDFSQFFVPLLILPFIGGGALGYAIEVREKGASSPSTFIASATKYYPKMIMGGIIAFIVYYIITAGSLMFVLAGLMADPFLGSMLGFLAVALAFLILMAIEFYDISIVADNAGVIAAFQNSIDFTRRNLARVVVFFIIVLVFKALIQMPLSFGMAGAMMANDTYYNALMAASNASFNNSTAAATNSTLNLTSLLSMESFTLSPVALAVVGFFQVLLQGFVFALLTLFKTEVYLTTKNRRKITDFDYDFSDEKMA